MYKKRLKTGINPLIPIVLWAVFIFMYKLIWGILQIIFEFNSSAIMVISAFLITFLFGFWFIKKLSTEYEITVSDEKIYVSKFLSKREKPLCEIAFKNIINFTYNKRDIKDIKIKQSLSAVPAFFGKKKYFIVYEGGNGCYMLTFKEDEKFYKFLNEKITRERGNQK